MESGFKTDRRLCLNADKTKVVEASDASAAILFRAAGRQINAPDAAEFGLECIDGKVVLPGCPEKPKVEPKVEPKAAKKPEDKSRKRGGDKAHFGRKQVRDVISEIDDAVRPSDKD